MIEIRRAALDEIVALRHRVLRAGRPLAAAYFPEDRDPATHHYAAFQAGQAVCCATFIQSVLDGQAAWQLRGMATEAGLRRQGIGGRLLLHAERDLAGEARCPLWCNAREIAAGFYEQHGWRRLTEAFDIEGFGAHFKMTKHLNLCR